jgi:hypothetical protein
VAIYASANGRAMKEIAARVEKARNMNPAELKDGSLRQQLVKEGFFERFNKKTRNMPPPSIGMTRC